MCGIFGIIKKNKKIEESLLLNVNQLLQHRGPNDNGIYTYKNVGISHTRLSIQDLSMHGKQPMSYDNDNLILSFNGEIYNYIELRKELKKLGYNFKTKTDSEVILASYKQWGEKCINLFNGMWSFAILDKRKNIIFISRDRFGIKPLYYYYDHNTFLFCSEIKPIRINISDNKANYETIMNYLVFGLEDINNSTFFNNINQLNPSNNIIYNLNTHKITISKYYNLKKEVNTIKNKYNDNELISKYDKTLNEAVKLRLRSDVKIGTCLSGGIDSSLICAYIKNNITNQSEQMSCITASSIDKENDESHYAKIVAESLNFKHVISKPNEKDFITELDNTLTFLEEPCGSPSIILQDFVFKTAKLNNCAVMLDGQGGDETMLGYERYYIPYLHSNKNINKFKEYINIINNSKLNFKTLFLYYIYFTNPKIRLLHLKNKTKFLNKKTKEYLNLNTLEDLNNAYLSHYIDLQTHEMTNQLRHLLKYSDRMSMKHSIESRLPFLDYNVVETALALDINKKITSGWTKVPLRNLLEKKINHEIAWRKHKIGFEAPSKIWLKNENFIKKLTENIKNSDLIKDIINKKELSNINEFLTSLNENHLWKIYNLTHWEKEHSIMTSI